MSDPFRDIPLFREIQKLLASGEGPVNLEIAKQIAQATAPSVSASPDPAWASEMSEATRTAEMVLSGYMRLVPEEPAGIEILTPAEWTSSTLEAWGWLFGKLSERFSSAFEGFAERSGGAGGMFGHIVPLMMGVQVGTLCGELATEAVGRYDLPVPRDDKGKLFVVATNAERLAKDYGFPLSELRKWLALREVGRHLVFTSSPWVGRYLRAALADIVSSVEIDLEDLERRMLQLGEQGMQGLEGMQAPQALPLVPTEAHARALARFQAFVATSEGYAANATSQVAAELVKDAGRIEEAMVRHAASPSAGKQALTTLLGISLDRDQRIAGMTFCNAITQLRGIDALNRLWQAPDNLPDLEEIRDPFAWIERVLET